MYDLDSEYSKEKTIDVEEINNLDKNLNKVNILSSNSKKNRRRN